MRDVACVVLCASSQRPRIICLPPHRYFVDGLRLPHRVGWLVGCDAGFEEPDCFYCFTAVMADVRDHFCSSLDRTTEGITATLQKMMDMLMEHDRVLADNLNKKRISPHFFALRWITLFLSQGTSDNAWVAVG